MLNERLITQLSGKMDPSLRVAPEKAPLGVACMDAGQGREQDALSFARCSFGVTKPRASRLDWHFFRGNSNDSNSVNRPWHD